MKAIYVPKRQLDATLRAPALAGKHNLEPFLSFAKEHSLPFNILEDSNVTNDAEIHIKDDDLWQCLEGEVTFVCGGEEYILKPGDWLWIPAGVPHQHSAKGVARLIIIKIPR